MGRIGTFLSRKAKEANPVASSRSKRQILAGVVQIAIALVAGEVAEIHPNLP
jgi:hypothetical protein